MKKHITIHVRVEDNLHQKIDKTCKQIRMSKSDFIRDIMEEKCDEILMGKTNDYHTNLLEEILTRTAFNQAGIIEGLEQNPNTHEQPENRFRAYGREVLDYTKNK